MSRTTHSDLAKLILDHADRLSRVAAGYLVSDASTRNLLVDAARILVEQDRRIETLTVALRDSGDRQSRAALVKGAHFESAGID